MMKQYIDFVTNNYIIEVDGKIVFSIELKGNNELEIRTPKDVYSGDIFNVQFKK